MDAELTSAFERIHDKLDANKDYLNDKMEVLGTKVTTLQTRFDEQKVVTQPCCFFEAHKEMFDNCNSLHTNSYDEAITTPTQESVRRAVAIQMIINKEFGLNICENPWQGSFIVDELTDLVEEAVYQEFERISERGGVLGAMDTMYQRSKIQDESLYYESLKHDGTLPIVGVNTFLPPGGGHGEVGAVELMRSTEDEKNQQVKNVEAFRSAHGQEGEPRLLHLQQVARERKNTFEALIEAAKTCSLGSMSHSLYEVGGEYRRNM